MFNALEALDGVNIIKLGEPLGASDSLWSKIQQKIIVKIAEIEQHYTNRDQVKKFINLVSKQLKENHCDIIFAPVCKEYVCHLSTDKPIVSLSDATADLLYNDEYSAYDDEESYLLSCRLERLAIQKSCLIVYSSDWAANSAITDFEASSEQIRIIPFGANLDIIPSKEKVTEKLPIRPFNLLFIGKDWFRKGGEIAYQTMLKLLEMGIEVKLTMIGSVPPDGTNKHPNLEIISFLNKDIKEEQSQLQSILLDSHILLFPTRADCSPIALCEAAAYGIPAITSDVGGIPEIIRPGQNGFMLPPSATPMDYAQKIAEVLGNSAQYRELVIQSRQEYESRLNWSTWARNMETVFRDAFAKLEEEDGFGDKKGVYSA